MTFDEPIDFEELVQRAQKLGLMPTTLSSAELVAIEATVKERAFFSAKVDREDLLAKFKSVVDEILMPESRIEGGVVKSRGLSFAKARTLLRGAVAESGYQPEPGKAGTIQDLGSDPRLDLIIRTNVQTAQGYGEFIQGNTDEALELYPCWELFRLEARKEPRDWKLIWQNAAEQVGDAGAIAALKKGKMVARKDSDIWVAISEFDRPYPPFRYNSGMWIRDVDRDTAVELGVIEPLDVIQPRTDNFQFQEAA